MSKVTRQAGFSLISAVFILVILATLAGYMVSLSGIQSSVPVGAIQGARAMNAARSGTEWASYLISNAPSAVQGCNNVNNATLNFSVNGLNNFSVSIACSLSTHVEGGIGNFHIITLVVTATHGSFGTTDYIERVLRTSLMRK